MDAFILAAGRGERLRPVTNTIPKSLLDVNGKGLIEHGIDALAEAGFTNIVINHAHLGEQIVARLGDGSRYGVHIRYSDESGGALETGGGIVKALQLLRSDPFLVVNGDIWTDYPFRRLRSDISGLAHLVLVDNPPHNRGGDFYLVGEQVRTARDQFDGRWLTFAGIGVYRRVLFTDCTHTAFPLAPLLREAALRGEVTAEHYTGQWIDVGTPERLAQVRRLLPSKAAH